MKISLAFWVALTVALIGLVVIVVPELPRDSAVIVTAVDLPAFHRIEMKDLITRKISGRDKPDGAYRNTTQAVGRVTRAPIGKGKPITPEDVTAKVKPAHYEGRVPFAFDATATTVAAVSPGDTVGLLFAPTAETERGSVAVSALVVNSADKGDGITGYVVGVSREDRLRIADIVARSRLLVVPDRP